MMNLKIDNTIKFLDVGYTYASLKGEMDVVYKRVMDAGWFIGGSEVANFEKEFADYCETDHCIGMGNGYDALFLLLKAYGITNGDEVIVSGHTFIATWFSVSNLGAIVKPVDARADSMNLNADLIERQITNKTKAIIVVHLYGLPVYMDKIMALGKAYGIPVIEDAAQAHGATYKGRKAGGLADAAAFSFYPGKNLGCFGDGGAITTNDKDIANTVRSLANYGTSKKYYHDQAGVNSRLDPLQAAFLSVKLKYLDEWNTRRKEIAHIYINGLSDLELLQLPIKEDVMQSSWHLFVIRYHNRDWLQEELKKQGVQTIIHYPIPNHLAGAYPEKNNYNLPVTESICKTCLSLPIGPHLTDEDVQYVVSIIRNTLLKRLV